MVAANDGRFAGADVAIRRALVVAVLRWVVKTRHEQNPFD
jgi:hypothetical protein